MANNSAMWMGGSTVAATGVLSLPALILLSVVMVSFSRYVAECNMQYVNLQSCGFEHFISNTQLTYFGNFTDIIKHLDALSGICSRIFGTQESISNVREDITYNIH